ncbi:MAG: hypothetical protein R3F24_00330 [Gammaproteobacteria bacterium]
MPDPSSDPFRAVLSGVVLSVERPRDETTFQATQSFLWTIGRAHIFKEVDFSDHVVGRPQLVLSAYQGTEVSKTHDFQCFEPMLFVLTVGVVPSYCAYTLESTFVLSNPSGKSLTIGPTRSETANASGWLMLPLALTSGWSFGRKGISVENELIYAAFKLHEPEIMELLE